MAPSAAFAGGVGDFLSPAFGTSCANQHTGSHTAGETTSGTGTVTGLLAGLPLSGPVNQCGGADIIIKRPPTRVLINHSPLITHVPVASAGAE